MAAHESQLLLPYVPIDRQHAACYGRELPDRTSGAALFADLSGFTQLTQALANAYGPSRGAEELTRYLAKAYEALIGASHTQRGTTIGFSGDAITCWFDGDDGRAAVEAGFAMQQALASVPAATAGTSRVQLRVKVAIVAGAARRMLVGDPSIQWIDALAGRTIDRLAAMEKLARPDEVVVDAALQSTLGLAFQEMRRDESTGNAAAVLQVPEAALPERKWSYPAQVDAEWARRWVLPPVRDRLLEGFDLLAADFRPSAALFLSFRGIDYDVDEEAGSKLDAFIRWVQGVVAELEGALIQLTFGDKGSYLYCTFGAPVAHGDDAARAVAAAQLLRSPPHPYVRDVKIGVTYGQMYAGAYGSTMRCTYGVLGPKTNLAARLMGVAEPGQVLCDADIVQQASRHWTFAMRPPVRLKGVDHEVPVFVPEGRAAAAGSAAANVVGRAAELRALREAARAVREGRTQVLALTGPAGIGKSRLLRAFEEACAVELVDVAVGGEHVWGREAAFRPWRPIVWRLLGLPGEPGEVRIDMLFERVAGIAPDMLEWVPLLGDVFGVELPPTDLTRDLAPESRSRNRTLLLTELMARRTAAGPWSFVLDEAHQLDSVSWDLLLAMVRAAREASRPLGVVLALRAQELDPRGAAALEELQPLLSRPTLELGELSGDELAAIVEERYGLPAGGLPEPLSELLATRASGNPFYAEELVQMLLDDGTIRRRAQGSWELASSRRGGQGDGGIPRSLHGLVLARIDRAPAAAGRTLKVASVIGRRFDVDLLQVATEGGEVARAAVSSRELIRHLDALTTRELVSPERAGRFRFPHVTVHQVAYESLLFAQRRALHAVIAGWQEEREDLIESEKASLLAHHWARAATGSGNDELIDRAAGWLVKAADFHGRVSAFAEAADACAAALELYAERSSPSELEERIRVRLGDMHERLGNFEEAEACYQRALEHGSGPATMGAALASLCLVLTRRGRYADARDAGERALEANPDDATLTALVRGRMGILAALQGDFAEAEANFESAYRHYLDAGQPRNAVAWLNNIGLGLIFQERYGEAELRLGEALELSRAERIAEIEAQVLTNLGLCAHKQGDLDLAAERYRSSLELSRKLLAREDAVINAVNLGDIALAKGDAADAWAAFLPAAREAAELGAMPRALDALRGAAEVLVTRGQAELAAEVVGFILAHPAVNVEVQGEVERVCVAIGDGLSDTLVRDARSAGASKAWVDIMERLGTIRLES